MSGGDLMEIREFPTRYNALPRIGGPTNPNNQMVTPREVAVRASVPLDYRTGLERSEAEDRFRQMDARFAYAERTNQGLLEEVAQNKNELRAQIRRAEEAVQNEQAARQILENLLQGSRDVILQLAARLQRMEEKRQEDRGLISGLVTQLRGVEQQSSLSQKDSFTRRELQAARMEEMLTQLNEAVRSKDQLERTVYAMTSELQQIRAKVDAQSMDMVMTTNELKNKSLKLEEGNKFAVENIRKTSETQSYAEQSASHLKSLIEQRLVEVRDAIIDLRNKQEIQQKEQRSSEQRAASRMSEFQLHMGEQNRKRDEALLAMELSQRDREHAVDLEMGKLQSRLTEVSEDLNHKLMQKEMKIREENQARYAQIEMALASETESRERSNRLLKDEMELQLGMLRKTMIEEIEHLKELQAIEKKKMNETLHKLHDAVTLVEQQLEEYKKQQDRLFAAEIQSRKLMESTLMSKVIDLEEKLLTAVKILQDNMAGVANQTRAKEDLLEELRRIQELQMKTMTDLESRLNEIMPAEEQSRNQFIEDLRSEIAEEAKHRDEEVSELREQISNSSLAEREKQARKLSELRVAISKLWENVESVKAVLGVKLETEEKQLQELKQAVEDLRKHLGEKGFMPEEEEEEEQEEDKEEKEEEDKEGEENEENDGEEEEEGSKKKANEDEEEENDEEEEKEHKEENDVEEEEEEKDEEEEKEDDKGKKDDEENEDEEEKEDEEEDEEDEEDEEEGSRKDIKPQNKDEDEEEGEEDEKDKESKDEEEEDEEDDKYKSKKKGEQTKVKDDTEEEDDRDDKKKDGERKSGAS